METLFDKTRLWLAAVLAAAVMVSCFNEGDEGCPVEITIGFDYTAMTATRPGYGIDPREVGSMDIFIFDSRDVLVVRFTDMNINFSRTYAINAGKLIPGGYRIVGWGNRRDSYEITPVPVAGTTTFGELRMSLIPMDAGRVITENPGPVFHSGAPAGRITVHERTPRKVVLGTIRDNHDLNFTFGGFSEWNDHSFNCTITDDNASYLFDNSFALSDPVSYSRVCERGGDGSLHTSMQVMRLERHRSPVLVLRDMTLEEKVLSVDLVPLILKREATEGPVDFTNQYLFDIEIIKNPDTTLAIWINGWKCTDYGNVLQMH